MPPRPSREARAEARARPNTSTASPATPERGKEGEDEALSTSATAAVFGDATTGTHTYHYLDYTHGQSRGSPPPRGAGTAAGSGGEQQICRRDSDEHGRLSFA